MAFQFSLDTLFRLRVSLEQKEERALEEIARRITVVKQLIVEVERERSTAIRRQHEALAIGISASEMHFELSCDEVREQRHRQLTNQLVELQKEHRRQQVVYLEARQKREILENLRDRQEAEYRRERARQEQQAVDDLFLMRTSRL